MHNKEEEVILIIMKEITNTKIEMMIVEMKEMMFMKTEINIKTEDINMETEEIINDTMIIETHIATKMPIAQIAIAEDLEECHLFVIVQ